MAKTKQTAPNRLERKDELRLYDWMKENYSQLEGKTANQAAVIAGASLGLTVSGFTMKNMVEDMGAEPFWNVRRPRAAFSDDTGMQEAIEALAKAVSTMQGTLGNQVKAFGQVDQRVNYLAKDQESMLRAIEGTMKDAKQLRADVDSMLRTVTGINEALEQLTQVASNAINRLERVEKSAEIHEKDLVGVMRRHMAAEKRVAHLEDVLSQVMLHFANQGSKQALVKLHDAHKGFVLTARDEEG